MTYSLIKHDQPLTVVCFLWGDWCLPHGEEYVQKLQRAVTKNLTLPFKFLCFTDRAEIKDVRTRPLNPPSWLGNLPKLYAFSPAAGLKGRVLVLDLDTVIVDNFDDIASFGGRFCVRAWFKGLDAGRWIPDGDTIAFEAGTLVDELWTPFVKDVAGAERLTKGAERLWIQKHATRYNLWQKLYPNQFYSYRLHCMQGLPKGAKLVSFHGQPRPHDVRDSWVVKHWHRV